MRLRRPLTLLLLAGLWLAGLRPTPASAQTRQPALLLRAVADSVNPASQFVVAVSSAYARQSADPASAPVFSVFLGQTYAVIERTSDDAWLLVQGPAAAGWLPQAYGVEAGARLPARDPNALPRVPAGVIPLRVSAVAQAVYERGLRLGRNPAAFSKLGDCNTENGRFLDMFEAAGDYRLGARYSYLRPTLARFQGSFARASLAAKSGFSAASLLDPTWADPAFCGAGETPLDCELRINNPSLALVMLGTHIPGRAAELEPTMRRLLDTILAAGVLPILATKADNVEGDGHVNDLIRALAAEYELPLWDFWAAVQPLPAGGLALDGIHFTYGRSYFDDDWAMSRGWTWRNLTALLALDAVLYAATPDPATLGTDYY